MYVHKYIWNISAFAHVYLKNIYIYICMYVCMYVHVYLYIHAYVHMQFIYIYMHLFMQFFVQRASHCRPEFCRVLL